MRDQLVLDRQRPLRHQRLRLRGWLPATLPERPGMLERGDRAVLGEAPLVPGRELARVQCDRGDLALADADFHASPDEVGSSE
jgi:hypothetical protein